MGDFNEGLRIEVENDLYRIEGEKGITDDTNGAGIGTGAGLGSITERLDKPSTISVPMNDMEESDKEDGELSGQEGNGSLIGDDDDMAMEVDGVEEVDEDSSQLNVGSSNVAGASMPRPSTDSAEKAYRPRTYPNPFVSDILVSEEKLSSRAARFGIAPGSQGGNVTSYVEQPLPSDGEIVDLYVSLGLIEDDGGEPALDKVGSHFRLNSILIRGTNQMSTEEIFGYLRDNNQRPLEMEWVNDACCIVNYKDKYEAARSLLSITKPVLIEPRPQRKETEDGELETEEMSLTFDFHAAESVSSRYITVPMPPGHTWRFSVPCKQARGILMRYATTQDKKQEKSERHSEYYKKFGNPNYTGPVGYGIVTKSFRNRIQQNKLTKQAEETEETVEEVLPQPISNRTAWAQLSQRWNDEENGTTSSGGGGGVGISGKGKNFKAKPNFNVSVPNHPHPHQHRRRNDHESPFPHPFSPTKKNFKVLVDFEDRGASIKSRLKRRREPPQDEEEREDSNNDYDSDSDDEEAKWSKKLKGPRMRMHADEEEQRMRERIRRQGVNRIVSRPANINSRLSNRLNWFSGPRVRHVQEKDDDY